MKELSSPLRITVLGVASLFLVLLSPDVSQAQQIPPSSLLDGGLSQVQEYDYGRPGYPRVTIYLWGNAQNGMWTVEQGTNFLEYLSVAARGNFNEAAETRVKNKIRLYREGQIDDEPVFEADLEAIFSRKVDYPKLQSGDVLIVESIQRRRFFTFRNMSQVVGTTASLVSLGLLVFN